MSHRPVIVWFQDDLRLHDHPALVHACQTGQPLLCVFILETPPSSPRPLGHAARWWLHGALKSLQKALEQKGGHLLILTGSAEKLIPELVTQSGASDVFTHHRQTPHECRAVETISHTLPSNVHLHQYCGNTLLAPDIIKNKSQGVYRVFTPFWNALNQHPIPMPLPCPEKVQFLSRQSFLLSHAHLNLDSLLPHAPDWAGGLRETWDPTLEAAHERLNDFISHDLTHYETSRNHMGEDGSSRLSPYIAFGQISPRYIWHAVQRSGKDKKNTLCFLSEIAWREFAYYTLYHSPHLLSQNLNHRFDDFPWQTNSEHLNAWQRGRTGIPIVDAGMRELWHTGWMHNRARMIVGSFLTRHLRTHWREGETWFWDTLVDASYANNAMNWQWIAGTGIDATPYFRIFNPTLQAKKFDPYGDYIRHWIPELRRLSNKYLFEPWNAPPSHIKEAGLILGDHYPYPIVRLSEARQNALNALASCKKSPP